MGVYASAVQSDGYRDAKVSTLLDTVSDVVGPDADGGAAMRWLGPDGSDRGSAAVLMVSNNPYRLGALFGNGTRPRLDGGVLGVAATRERGESRLSSSWTCADGNQRCEGMGEFGTWGPCEGAVTPAADACGEPVLRPNELERHPIHVAGRAFTEDASGHRRLRTPLRARDAAPPAPAPRLGGDTREVLLALGATEADLERLAAAKAILV